MRVMLRKLVAERDTIVCEWVIIVLYLRLTMEDILYVLSMQGTVEIFTRNIKEHDSMSNREIAAELLEQNVDTIEAMKEIDNMIKTGSGQHFEGSTEDFMRMMLQN